MYGLYLAVCCFLICHAASQNGSNNVRNDKQMQNILSQLTAVVAQLENVTARLDTALATNSALSNNLTALQQYVVNLEKQLNATDAYAMQIDERLYRVSNSHLANLEDLRDTIEERFEEVNEELTKTRRKITHVDNRVTAMNESLLEKIGSIEDLVNYVIESVNQKDAFVAYTRNFAILVEEGGVIPFSHTYFQIGPGFNTTTHTFTCQHNGLYLFSTSVVNYFYWHKASAHIVKEGERISASVHADTFAREWNQGSVVTVTECRKGERVWVKVAEKSRIHGGDEIQSYTQFVGMLLQIQV